MPVLDAANVSVEIEITSLAGSRLNASGEAAAVNYDVKAKLEERDHRSQTITVSFAMLLTTKPSTVKLEVEGTAVLKGKDDEIKKMLDNDPETKFPRILPRVYQHAFLSMYLLSTILNAPPPPQNLLGTPHHSAPVEEANVEVSIQPAETEGESAAQVESKQ